MHNSYTKGISLIEVLVGVAVLSMVLGSVVLTLTVFFSSAGRTLADTRATYLAEEGIEAMRFIRDEDWNEIVSLATSTTYYFDISTTTLATTTVPEVIEGIYSRSFVLDNTERDGNDDLVESGGTDEAGGRFVTVTVSWGSRSVSLTSALFNIHDI